MKDLLYCARSIFYTSERRFFIYSLISHLLCFRFCSCKRPSYPFTLDKQMQNVATQQGTVVEGRYVIERPLPCFGLGCGWCLFIIGFFLAAIPWFVGAIILLCSGRSIDYREKPGYAACTIAAVVATLSAIIGSLKGAHDWYGGFS